LEPACREDVPFLEVKDVGYQNSVFCWEVVPFWEQVLYQRFRYTLFGKFMYLVLILPKHCLLLHFMACLMYNKKRPVQEEKEKA